MDTEKGKPGQPDCCSTSSCCCSPTQGGKKCCVRTVIFVVIVLGALAVAVAALASRCGWLGAGQ